MKKYKHVFYFLTPICLLILIPLIPFALSKWDDERLLSSINIEEVNDKSQQAFQTSQLNTSEKIGLLSSFYGENEQNIILVSQKETKLNTHIHDIKSHVQVELNKLQKLNIFPVIDFENDYNSYSYIPRVYSQPTNPEKSVVVDIITYSSKDGFIEIWIDAQTQTIYQYLFYSDQFFTVPSQESHSVFGHQYLHISEEDIQRYYYMISNEKNLCIGINNLKNN